MEWGWVEASSLILCYWYHIKKYTYNFKWDGCGFDSHLKEWNIEYFSFPRFDNEAKRGAQHAICVCASRILRKMGNVPNWKRYILTLGSQMPSVFTMCGTQREVKKIIIKKNIVLIFTDKNYNKIIIFYFHFRNLIFITSDPPAASPA